MKSPLATYLARAIFECGDNSYPGGIDRCQRIQFMGGEYPDHETALGGLGESSLESFLDHLIRNFKPEADRCTCKYHQTDGRQATEPGCPIHCFTAPKDCVK